MPSSGEKRDALVVSEKFTSPKSLADYLSGSAFRYCEFESMEIEGLFVEGEFLGCFFTNLDWYSGFFNQALFVDTRFENCTFRGASFSDCRFLNCEFVNCRFLKDNLNADSKFIDCKWFDCKAMECSGLPEVESIAPMVNLAATAYIQKMIADFKIPGKDVMSECLLVAPGEAQPNWGAGIYVSDKENPDFYSDIYQFWVRACFSFAEEVQRFRLLQEVQPFIRCVEGSDSSRWAEYIDAIRNLVPNSWFLERQEFPETKIELERNLSDVTLVVDCPFLRSFVGRSNGEYLALFKLPDMFAPASK